jgi:hypothetical protein
MRLVLKASLRLTKRKALLINIAIQYNVLVSCMVSSFD